MGFDFLTPFYIHVLERSPNGSHNSTLNTICFMHKGEHAVGE